MPETPLNDLDIEVVCALEVLIMEDRDAGFFAQEPYHPQVGCECGSCRCLRALARLERGGRCILCACTDEDGCEQGCSWVDPGHFLCSAHPPKLLAAAKRFIRKWTKQWTPTKKGKG